jgi:hypothetical protein
MAIAATKLATIDEMVAEVMEEIVEAHVSIDQAVRDWFARRSLDPASLEELARIGAAKVVSDTLHRSRGLSEPEDPTDEKPRVRSGRLAWVNAGRWHEQQLYRRLYGTFYEAADGQQKPLAFFTLQDWEALSAKCDGQIAGWTRRKAMCERAKELLSKHSVELTHELPDEAKQELDAAIVEAQS